MSDPVLLGFGYPVFRSGTGNPAPVLQNPDTDPVSHLNLFPKLGHYVVKIWRTWYSDSVPVLRDPGTGPVLYRNPFPRLGHYVVKIRSS